MGTVTRFGVASFYTLILAIGAVIYQRVFVETLLPLIDESGIFSDPVFILERLVPIVLLVLLLAAWIWVVAGAVQDETTVDRRRIRR